MALWANRPPNASVVATEPSKLLILTQSNFDRFMAAVPEFRALFTTHTNAFARLSQLTHAKQQLFGSTFGSSMIRVLSSVYHGSQEDRDLVRADEADRSALELLVVHRWDKLARAVLDHGPFSRIGVKKVERAPCTLSFEIEDFEHKGTPKPGEKAAHHGFSGHALLIARQ